jgi:hypothetical protein
MAASTDDVAAAWVVAAGLIGLGLLLALPL